MGLKINIPIKKTSTLPDWCCPKVKIDFTSTDSVSVEVEYTDSSYSVKYIYFLI